MITTAIKPTNQAYRDHWDRIFGTNESITNGFYERYVQCPECNQLLLTEAQQRMNHPCPYCDSAAFRPRDKQRGSFNNDGFAWFVLASSCLILAGGYWLWTLHRLLP